MAEDGYGEHFRQESTKARSETEGLTENPAMKLIWMTDIHLGFLESDELRRFWDEIVSIDPDALLVGGDIGEAPSVVDYLHIFEEELHCPIYFVLGNHDYYRGSIDGVRHHIREVVEESERLRYLPITGTVRLTQESCLIGHDSWADGRYGDYQNSEVLLNDYVLIEELSNLNPQSRLAELNKLGDEAADFFRKELSSALLDFQHILVLTHVPPFAEASWHEGNLSDDNYLPHFACKAVGDVFIDLMAERPDRNLTVLCGHTHSSGMCQIPPNIFVRTGGAVYGQPHIQDPIFVSQGRRPRITRQPGLE